MSISKDFLNFGDLNNLYPHVIDSDPLLDSLYPEQLIKVSCPQYEGTPEGFNCRLDQCPIKKIEPKRSKVKNCIKGKFNVTWTKFILYKGLVNCE